MYTLYLRYDSWAQYIALGVCHHRNDIHFRRLLYLEKDQCKGRSTCAVTIIIFGKCHNIN